MLFPLLFAFVVLLFLYIKIKYFSLRGPIPGLSPHVLLGNLLQAGVLSKGLTLDQALQKFRKRFGDTFQFWFGSLHVIVVTNINDVQHIFYNRRIYDHGDMFVQRTNVLFPDGLICLRG